MLLGELRMEAHDTALHFVEDQLGIFALLREEQQEPPDRSLLLFARGTRSPGS